MLFTTTFIFALQFLAVSAKLQTFNWNIGWVSASPDGLKRPFVGINGQWPCPSLAVNLGDTIKINAYNGLGNESTSIHFHGIFQNGTTFMDGAAMVSQCPIAPGQKFVYEFKVTQTGTYWYHAHIGGQYVDGFRGPIVIHDPKAPFKYDQEIVMTLSDLYHDQAPSLINYYQSPDNENNFGGTEPVPDSNLINESQNVHFPIVAGKTYLFRIINMGAFASQWLQFDQHTMTIVEVDGVYTQPYDVPMLFLATAQRYSVLVKAMPTNTQNFAIVAQMEMDMFDSNKISPNMLPSVTSWLVYNSAAPLPSPFTITPQPFDDAQLVPFDQQPLLNSNSIQTIYFTADFGVNANGQVRGFMNGQTYVAQKVPTLYTVLSAPAADLFNPTIYGQTNPQIIPFGTIVEMEIDNHDQGNHPFHLHGHNFQVVNRFGGAPNIPDMVNAWPAIPMRRDTVVVPGGGSVTIRFKADNPGVNLFHCHIEWHVEAGLTATIIEAPDVLQKSKPYIPASHKSACKAQNILMKGNAAGNSKNWLDLTGANTVPALNNWGALVNPPA